MTINQTLPNILPSRTGGPVNVQISFPELPLNLQNQVLRLSVLAQLTGGNVQLQTEDGQTLQARLELWGEGQSYYIMKRRRETRTRGSNWLDFKGVSFTHDDERLTFEIPQDEIVGNPNISDQN